MTWVWNADIPNFETIFFLGHLEDMYDPKIWFRTTGLDSVPALNASKGNHFMTVYMLTQPVHLTSFNNAHSGGNMTVQC